MSNSEDAGTVDGWSKVMARKGLCLKGNNSDLG